MNINMIDIIGKSEKTINKLHKSLEAFSIFTFVSSVIFTMTTNKT